MTPPYEYLDKDRTRLKIEGTAPGDALVTAYRDRGDYPAAVGVVVRSGDAPTVAFELLRATARPDSEIIDRTHTGFGVFRSEGGQVLHETCCDGCGGVSTRRAEPETGMKIAAALAVVSEHAAANPQPEFTLAARFHNELCSGTTAGSGGCADCLGYARLAMTFLAEQKDL